MHPQHKAILEAIKALSGKPTAHTGSDSYLGTSHPRYPINIPTLRSIAREWIGSNSGMNVSTFGAVLTSLIRGESSTEKVMAGLLLNMAKPGQRSLDPEIIVSWLDHLEGWAEVDCLCTGTYAATEVPRQWPAWKKLIDGLSRSPNINRRRASLVFFCSPLRKTDDPRLIEGALKIIDRLKGEKPILITKAISWLLRSAVKHHKMAVKKYVALNKATLPAIAVRETHAVLTTGRKTKPKE